MVVNAEGKRPGNDQVRWQARRGPQGNHCWSVETKKTMSKPRGVCYCGISSDETCLRAERHPAWEVAWACRWGG